MSAGGAAVYRQNWDYRVMMGAAGPAVGEWEGERVRG